ncbi:MAG: carboxylesterase/lipase family protein, partial [Flavitalea sp.]
WSSEYLIQQDLISEDCLYLNVWTSSKNQTKKKPVLVWIYGGGFGSGGTNVPIYDGEAMAKKDIVFVSINYRVGLFGFFAHPELTKESGRNASGNYGLMDQVAALKWVKENIAAFGGDPGNVTIAGQSAGSMSVNSLVASPLAKGLFKKAIAQSGANLTRSQPMLADAEKEGLNVMQKLGVTNLDELRKLDEYKLMKVGSSIRGPIIDGYVLPQQIADIIISKKQNKITLLTGWNEDEGFMMGGVKKADAYKKDFVARYGEDLLKYYPGSNDDEAAGSQKNLSRDLTFGMQNYAWAMLESKQGRNVYVYRFTRKVPGYGEYADFGAFHTGEVPYAYGNLDFVNRPWEAVDKQLEKTMLQYWVNFIKTGNPNGSGLPEWPTFKSGDQMIMDLGTDPSKKKLPDGEALEMLHKKVLAK